MSGIGEQLRKAREAKGLSISDIEKATKIQSRYLEAIENNDFDKLPGDFYVRAFIRQYAQIVGLDGKELLSQYQGEVANEVSQKKVRPKKFMRKLMKKKQLQQSRLKLSRPESVPAGQPSGKLPKKLLRTLSGASLCPAWPWAAGLPSCF